MSQIAKTYRFPISFGRIFVRPEDKTAYDLIPFSEQEKFGESVTPALSSPDNWSDESVLMLGEAAACKAIPEQTTPIEENTVPSWLWRGAGASAHTTEETSVQHILDRVVGAAAYRGWKESLFADDFSARAFYDEARYALAQRFIAVHPRALAGLGIDWAYGIEASAAPQPAAAALPRVDIPNAVIDGIVSGSLDKTVRGNWQQATAVKAEASITHVRFADTASEWTLGETRPMNAAFDLMAFRHNDGSVNIEALRHSVRILVMLLDLHGLQPVIGFNNLAPLLMALAIPYDSEAGRATAASIAALIAAEATMMSAELAGLRGISPDFAANREFILRSLRNHRRSAYGETNDYEKISVLPVPLNLEACPDLALAAAARSQWDDALQLAQHFGLRHIGMTSLTPSPELSFFAESLTQGLEPLRSLTVTTMEGDTHNTLIHPSVSEALTRLDYDTHESQLVARHICGAKTLDHAPHINPTALRSKGFDQAALDRVENYLPQAKSLRFAFTPWILGAKFCRDVLKVTDAQIDDLRFDLLRHLGFSSEEIMAANTYCYGSHNLRDAAPLRARDASVFATQDNLSPESRIRMAASLQPHLSGETGLTVALNPLIENESVEKIVLMAWRQGLQSFAIAYDNDVALSPTPPKAVNALATLAKRKAERQAQPSVFAHATKAPLPTRKSKTHHGKIKLAGMEQGKARQG